MSTKQAVLAPDTGMDAVTLRVGDLANMSSYYEKALALQAMEEKSHGNQVYRVLGRNGVPFVRLISTPGLPVVDRHQAGLYHTAWLFPDHRTLAATVYHTARDPRSRFVGSSDHLVSKAFYFTDPEGNGIELYLDRPREDWVQQGGEIAMDTIYLDPEKFLREHLREEEIARTGDLPGKVGHVHLQVGDVAQARQFYVEALGFEPTLSSYRGALFASAGGYHHHVAMNSWHSRGTGPRAATLGLGSLAITVADREQLDRVAQRLRERGLWLADDGHTVRTRDPWDTQVTLSLPGTSTEQLLEAA